MKKLNLLFCLLLTAIGVNAQSNLFEELAKYDGQEFKAFYIGGHRDVEGGYKFEEREGWLKAKVHKDKYGKEIGVSMEAAEGGQRYLTFEWNPRYDRIDHYTQPAFVRSTNGSKDAVLMIDGLFFDFSYTSEDLGKYDPDYVYVPRSIIEKPKEEEATAEDGKKKGKFKAFMKDVGKAAIGKSTVKVPHFLLSIDTEEKLKSIVTSYLEGMRTKQATPLTAEEEKRWAEVMDMKRQAAEEIAEYNRKFYASEEGQAQLKRLEENRNRDRAACRFTVKNTGSNQYLYIITHLTPHSLSSGESKVFDCNDKVYYSNNKGDKLGFVGGGSDSYSGRTISVQ